MAVHIHCCISYQQGIRYIFFYYINKYVKGLEISFEIIFVNRKVARLKMLRTFFGTYDEVMVQSLS